MLKTKKAFFLPYILIFIFIASVFLAFKLSFVSSMLETANLERENAKINTEIDNKYTIFKNILSKTNSDSWAVSPDNDDYSSTYSWTLWRNIDDDIDAFSYWFWYISTWSFNTQNIFTINSDYLAYSSGITNVASLSWLTILSNNSYSWEIYLFDSYFNQKKYMNFSWNSGLSNFSIWSLTSSYMTWYTLAAFLYNSQTTDMFYRYNFTNTSNILVNDSMSAKNNGTGSYLYLWNYIYKNNDNFIIRKKYFKN